MVADRAAAWCGARVARPRVDAVVEEAAESVAALAQGAAVVLAVAQVEPVVQVAPGEKSRCGK